MFRKTGILPIAAAVVISAAFAVSSAMAQPQDPKSLGFKKQFVIEIRNPGALTLENHPIVLNVDEIRAFDPGFNSYNFAIFDETGGDYRLVVSQADDLNRDRIHEEIVFLRTLPPSSTTKLTCYYSPDLVCGGRIHLLGVRAELRDAIVAAEPGGSGPPRWFRSPATAHDPDAWSRLAATRPFARSVGACYFPSPVAGGAITWSAWRRSPALNTAIPAPGVDWQLLDPGRGGAPNRDGNGVLTSKAAPAEAIGQPLLGRIAGDSLWVTSIGAHRDGQRLPAVELEALVQTGREQIRTSVLIDDPRAGAVLVVFARPDRTDDPRPGDALVDELEEQIAVELAPHLVPPRIEVFTVSPRFGEDGVDRDWCRGQYVSGRLAAKQREPVFTALARLRAALAD